MSTDKAMVTDEQVRAYKQAYTAHLNALIASKSPDATGDISFEATRVGLLAALSEAEQQPVAPADVYRVLKRAHMNGTLDDDHLSSLSREIAALSHPPAKREAGEAAAPVQGERVSDTPSAAVEFDDEVIAYAQEIVDDREADGCKVYVSDVIDALRAALEASHE